jgi:hypothetical protein
MAFESFATAVGESGNDAGRLEADDGDKIFVSDVVWNVEALFLD